MTQEQRDVFVLGAGFSRAISDHMPITDELGNACLAIGGLRDDHRVPAAGFQGGSFETWLSQLADEQPYLSAHENLENQALFLRFSEAIAQVLGERMQAVLAIDCPEWLVAFTLTAHQKRSTLITFNYDTLLECLVSAPLLCDFDSEPVSWGELTGNVPGWSTNVSRYGSTPAVTFRLLKLHGSLNWYWTPGDFSGVSVARRLLPGNFLKPEPYLEEDRRRELPGRVPFVVPPSASKSAYYRNPVTREFWRQAAERLAAADRIVVMGYSMPPTDLTFASLFAQSVVSSDCQIVVADINAATISKRIHDLGVPMNRIEVLPPSEGSPIQAFVSTWVEGVAIAAAQAMRVTGEPDHPLLLAWGTSVFASVETIEVTDQGVAVSGHLERDFNRATRVRGADDPPLPTLSDLLSVLGPDQSCFVRLSGDTVHRVIGHQVRHHDVGYGHAVWNVLSMAGSLPLPRI